MDSKPSGNNTNLEDNVPLPSDSESKIPFESEATSNAIGSTLSSHSTKSPTSSSQKKNCVVKNKKFDEALDREPIPSFTTAIMQRQQNKVLRDM